MTKKITLTLSLLFVLVSLGFAQTDEHDHKHESHRTCGTVDHMKYLVENDASLNAKFENSEKEIQKWVKDNPNFNSEKLIVTIPVVVHILYAYNFQNITDAQVQSQIESLNDDYRRTNSDIILTPTLFQSVAADCEIQFCLAQQDPNGNSTTGITRTSTTKTTFDINTNEAKYTNKGGKDIWNRSKYLNIWVVPAISDNGQGGILGYAQFPGGPSLSDGVVIQYRNFGTIGTATYPFNKGRTATHEVGHWLSLYHIWGDDGTGCWGTDYCSDTPNQGDENYGCPTFPESSCSNTSDMYMNYMDYTDDACMNLFTTTQKARMWAILNGSRSSLKSSTGCIPVGIIDSENKDINLHIYPNPSSGIFTLDFADNTLNENIYIQVFNTIGQEMFNKQTNLSGATQFELNISHLPKGLYQISISTKAGVENRKIMIQ